MRDRASTNRRSSIAVFLSMAGAVGSFADSRGGSVHFLPPARAPSAVPSTTAPKQIALLIGIADYLHLPEESEEGLTDLEAPPNDVQLMRHSLRGWGFDGDDVRVLLDRQASKAGIIEAFGWIAARASGPDDAVVIYFSGHGTAVPDQNGDEARTTPYDYEDEALVPWDAPDGEETSALLLDDEIRDFLQTLRTKNVTLIIDACFSGTVTRGAQGAYMRARGPVSLGGAGSVASDALTDPAHTLLTAAAPQERAWEYSYPPGSRRGRRHGAFTYHLARALDGAGRGPGRTTARYDEVLLQVKAGLAGQAAEKETQTPQLEGDTGARLFHVQGDDVPHRAFALVMPAGVGRFSIDAGAVHGVRRSAVYDVFAPGEMNFAGAPLAQLRVDSVAELGSYAVLVQEGTVPSGARAVLARVPSGAERVERIAVWVDQGEADLRDAITALPFVELAADTLGAGAVIRPSGGGFEVLVDGVSLPPIDSTRSVYEGSLKDLCSPLARALAIRTFQAIDNPEPPGNLVIRFQVVPAGHGAVEERGFGIPDTVEIGKRYDIYARVDAPEESVLYLSVAIQGFTSDPASLYPSARQQRSGSPVPLNTWIPIFRSNDPTSPGGIEVLKIWAGSDQFDFRGLTESLKGLCETTRGGTGKTSMDAPVTGWTAIDQVVVILPQRRGE